MDRRRSTQLLDILYGMDLRAPDWNPLLVHIAEVFRSHVVTVQVHDNDNRQGRLTWSFGLSDALKIVHRNATCTHPWFERGADKLQSHGIVDDRGLMTEDELKATRFHADFMLPAGIAHGIALCIYQRSGGDLTLLTINRDQATGHFDESEHELARSLLPHLRNVYAMQQRFGWLENQSLRFRSTLDQLSKGVLMLDADGHLLFCNIAARQMETEHLFTRRPDGRLGMSFPADDRLLHRALQLFATTPDAAPVTLSLHDDNGHLRGMLKLCPAAMMASTQWSEFQVSVLAFIKPMDATPRVALGTLLKAQWGLTPAEAKLAEFLMRGMSLKEAAERFRVTKNTVRTQLRALFEKTETRRQSELVRVLMELSDM